MLGALEGTAEKAGKSCAEARGRSMPMFGGESETIDDGPEPARSVAEVSGLPSMAACWSTA